jgi:hypothetical protein
MRVLASRLGGALFLGCVGLVTVACATGTTGDDTAFVPGDDSDGGSSSGTDATVGTMSADSGSGSMMMGTDSGGGSSNDSGSSSGTDSGGGGPCAGEVVINEIEVAGATASDEFTELYNPANCSLSLNSIALGYHSASGNDVTTGVPINMFVGMSGQSIPAHGFFLVGGSGYAGSTDAKATADMAGAGGRVAVFALAPDGGVGKVLDSVAYGTATSGIWVEKNAAAAPPAKQSIGRKPDGADTDDNATDFKAMTTPTPGAKN